MSRIFKYQQGRSWKSAVIGRAISSALMIIYYLHLTTQIERKLFSTILLTLTIAYSLIWIVTEVCYFLKFEETAFVIEHLTLVLPSLALTLSLYLEAILGISLMYPLLVCSSMNTIIFHNAASCIKYGHFVVVILLHGIFYFIFRQFSFTYFLLNSIVIGFINCGSICLFHLISNELRLLQSAFVENHTQLSKSMPIPYCLISGSVIKSYNELFDSISNHSASTQVSPIIKVCNDPIEIKNKAESRLELKLNQEHTKLKGVSLFSECSFLSLLTSEKSGTDLYECVFKMKGIISKDMPSYENIGIFTDNFSKEERLFNVFIRFFHAENNFLYEHENEYELLFMDVTLARKYEKLCEHIKYKEDKLVRTAHEFKTPLICSTILAEELREEIMNRNYLEAEKKSESLQRLSDYIFFLIDDIIQSSKTEIQRKLTLAVTIEVKCPDDDIIFCFEILQILLKIKENTKHVTCSLNIALEVFDCRIKADSVRLRQILLNFISNAVKFTKVGKISMNAQVDNDAKELIIEVRDTGIGMTNDKIKKLMQKEKIIDVELNKSMNKYGTGTGLIVAKSLSEMMGYQFEVSSVLQSGSVFNLRVPILKVETKHVSFKPENSQHNSQYSSFNENVFKHTTTDLPVILSQSSMSDDDDCYKEKATNLANISGYTSITPSASRASASDDTPRLSQISNTIELNINDELVIKDSSEHDFKKLKHHNRKSENLLSYKLNTNKENSPTKDKFRFSILSSKLRPNTSNLSNLVKGTLPSNPTKRILVCDDSPLLRNSLLKNLKGVWSIRSNFSFTSCSDGIEALLKVIQDQSEGNRIKILMIDERMEYLNGTQTVKIMRSLILESKIKQILFVSVSANDEAQLDSLNLYDLILTKPVTKKKLVDLFITIESMNI